MDFCPRSTAEFIINPHTGRQLLVGGQTYRKYLRKGLLGAPKSAYEVTEAPKQELKDLPPPPIGFNYRKINRTGEFKLVKSPFKQKSEDTLELAVKAQLRLAGLEENESNISRLKRQMEDIILNDTFKQPREPIPRAVIKPLTKLESNFATPQKPSKQLVKKSSAYNNNSEENYSDTYTDTQTETEHACSDSEEDFIQKSHGGSRQRPNKANSRARAFGDRPRETGVGWRVVPK